MDKQLTEFCLTLGGISTGIQTHHYYAQDTNGLPHGTSTTDPWRHKPALRRQLLVDRS